MFKVLLTHRTFDVTSDKLREKGYEVDFITNEGSAIPREELIKSIGSKEYDAISCLLTDKIDKEFIDAAGSNLKVIANYAVGFDNIDVEYANKAGVIVTNTPGVLTNAVAEYAIALCFTASKRIVEADSFVRGGKYTGWEPRLFIGERLQGKTLGVVGLGRIGGKVAEIATKGLGMNVVYYDRKQNEEAEKNIEMKFFDNIDDVLRESDYVSIHLPLTDETAGIIDKSKFAIMKNTAILINTARGPLINEADLADALETNEIAYAAIDVFENEPSGKREIEIPR